MKFVDKNCNSTGANYEVGCVWEDALQKDAGGGGGGGYSVQHISPPTHLTPSVPAPKTNTTY